MIVNKIFNLNLEADMRTYQILPLILTGNMTAYDCKLNFLPKLGSRHEGMHMVAYESLPLILTANMTAYERKAILI